MSILLMDFLKDFGVQPILLLAQVVNFLLLLLILKKLLYKPILKILQQRKDTIAQSLKNAEEIEKKLLKTEEDREKVLAKAVDESKKIIEDATKSATQVIEDAHIRAGHDIELMLQKGRVGINQEREKMHQEIREEITDIVVASLQKVTGKIITKKDQKDLISKSIRSI